MMAKMITQMNKSCAVFNVSWLVFGTSENTVIAAPAIDRIITKTHKNWNKNEIRVESALKPNKERGRTVTGFTRLLQRSTYHGDRLINLLDFFTHCR